MTEFRDLLGRGTIVAIARCVVEAAISYDWLIDALTIQPAGESSEEEVAVFEEARKRALWHASYLGTSAQLITAGRDGPLGMNRINDVPNGLLEILQLLLASFAQLANVTSKESLRQSLLVDPRAVTTKLEAPDLVRWLADHDADLKNFVRPSRLSELKSMQR